MSLCLCLLDAGRSQVRARPFSKLLPTLCCVRAMGKSGGTAVVMAVGLIPRCLAGEITEAVVVFRDSSGSRSFGVVVQHW